MSNQKHGHDDGQDSTQDAGAAGAVGAAGDVGAASAAGAGASAKSNSGLIRDAIETLQEKADELKETKRLIKEIEQDVPMELEE